MMRLLKFCIIGSMLLVLSSCGFHLREHLSFPKELQTIYISSATPYAQFEQYLKTILRDSNIKVVSGPDQAAYMLRINSHFLTQTVSGISANTQTRSYALNYKVTYDLVHQGETILAEQSIDIPQNYLSSSSQLGSTTDAQLRSATQEMQHQAAAQIINRLSSADVKKTIERQLRKARMKKAAAHKHKKRIVKPAK